MVAWDWDSATLAELERFLRERDIMVGPLTTCRIGDGHSNLTFLVSGGDRKVVVRRPPPPPTPPGSHDMLREARIVGALGGSAVPVPAVLATADVGELLDVPLYVMSFQDGPVITTRTPDALSTKGSRRELGEALVDTLVALHDVDWVAVGLEKLGRPDGFNARHLRRMAGLVADAEGAPPAHFAPIHDWLAANVPEESGATIVHNDFRIGNVIVAQDPPGRLQAVLDWELATIGDPLVDFGYMLASVPVPGEPMTPTQEMGQAMLEDGYPTRDELARRYAERSGRSLDLLPWYEALVLWKLGVLFEYGRRRAVRGVGDPYYADPGMVQSFLAAAHRAAGIGRAPEARPADLEVTHG